MKFIDFSKKTLKFLYLLFSLSILEFSILIKMKRIGLFIVVEIFWWPNIFLFPANLASCKYNNFHTYNGLTDCYSVLYIRLMRTAWVEGHPSFFISKKVWLEWTEPNSSGSFGTCLGMPKNEKMKMFHVGFFV